MWCMLHQTHLIQGVILARTVGGLDLMHSLYSTALVLRTSNEWLSLTNALESAVEQQLEIRTGRPPPDASDEHFS